MPFRRATSVFVAFAASLVLAVAAHAEARIALVVGNSNYVDVSPLTNPVNDVQLVAASLRETGFVVTALVDADQPTFENAVRNFAARLTQEGEDTVGLFYFAGHGVQHNGQNYLIPVNAPITAVTDLRYRAVAAECTVVAAADRCDPKVQKQDNPKVQPVSAISPRRNIQQV